MVQGGEHGGLQGGDNTAGQCAWLTKPKLRVRNGPVVSHGDAWQVTLLVTFDRCAISGGAPGGPEFRGINCNCLQSYGQSR